jgi:DnaJ-like protein/PilZ domain-containing protein
MDADRDYYQVLLVVPDAPPAMIEASYRTLKQRLRAKPGSVAAEALLDEAYRVLSNPEQRAAYDLERDVALSERETADFAATAVLDPDAARYAAHRCLFCGTEHGLDHTLERGDDCRECASPLYPAERHRLEYSGQRMLRRIPSRRAIDLYVSWPQAAAYQAEMRDISLNGMQFAVGAPLQANQIVKIDCASCAAVGRVAHCERDLDRPDGVERWLVGVEFLTLRFRNARGTFVSARA